MLILIRSDLKAHMESMNPIESCFDFTMIFSTMIDNSAVPEQHYPSVFEKYDSKIPLYPLVGFSLVSTY